MSDALPVVLALIVGAALGGGLGLAAIAYLRQIVTDLNGSHESTTRDLLDRQAAETKELLDQARELAHKISAPEQASIDHLFEKERERRSQERDQQLREEAAREIDRQLADRGIALGE